MSIDDCDDNGDDEEDIYIYILCRRYCYYFNLQHVTRNSLDSFHNASYDDVNDDFDEDDYGNIELSTTIALLL